MLKPLRNSSPRMEWRGLMTDRELSLQSTAPVGCVWALVLWCGVLQNHLLPLCAVARPKHRKHDHLSGGHRAVSCVCSCAQRDMAGWGWLVSGPCHVKPPVPYSLPGAVQCFGWSLHGRQLCLLCTQQRLTLTESFHWDTGKKSFVIYIVCWCFEPKSSLLGFPLGCVHFAREAGSIYEALRTSAIFLEFVLFCLWPSLWVLCCFCHRCVLQTDPLAGNPEFGKTEILLLFL